MAKSGLVLERDDLDEVIAQINALWRKGVLNTVVALGDYLIKTFYGGDLELAQSHSPTKPARLTQLFDRADELQVSIHALKESVRIAAQYHEMPRAVADGISKSHHAALLPVADLTQKVRYAQEAIIGKLS